MKFNNPIGKDGFHARHGCGEQLRRTKPGPRKTVSRPPSPRLRPRLPPERNSTGLVISRSLRHGNCHSNIINHVSNISIVHTSVNFQIWNFDSNARCYRFKGHTDAVMDLSFSPTGKLIASCSRDKSVRLWVPTIKGETGELKAHSQTVRSVDFSPCGEKVYFHIIQIKKNFF